MNITHKWNSLTIKTRWIIFYSLATLFFLLSYHFNFKKTIDLITTYPELKRSMLLHSIATEFDPDKYLRNTELVFAYDNKVFLKAISDFTDEGNITIQEVSKIAITESEGITIETNKIAVEGTYSEIINFLYYIEYQKKIAVINSASIEMVQNKLSGKYTLVAILYIKNVLHEKPTD